MTETGTETAVTWSLEDLEQQVIAASLHDTDILEYTKVRFNQRFSPRLQSLFNAAARYFDVTRGQLTRDALRSILVNNEPDYAKHDEYLSLFDALTSEPYTSYTEAERRWFLHEFDVQWQVRQTGEILARAAESMRTGHTAHGLQLTGPQAAWQVIAEAQIDFRNATAGNAITEIEITSTTDQAKQDYHKAVEDKYLGIQLKLPEVNQALGGLRPGDMYVVTAYAGEGKSFLMLNDAWTAFRAGKNVSLGTGEMGIRKYRARLVALHSTLPIFPLNLETTKIERGQLSKEEHEVFLDVLEDIKTNPSYGKFFLFAFPHVATPSIVFNRFSKYDQIVPLDLGVIDYLGLLTSERNRVSKREEFDDLIREVKARALDFGGGRGLPLQVGWQTNRSSYERARAEGYYTLSCFTDSPEMEKSADSALYLLFQPQNPDEIKAGFVKNRDNELGEPFFIRRSLRHAALDSMTSSRASKATPGGEGAALLDI